MRWQSREVTTVVVTSGEMLQQLWSLIPQWYREHWFTTLSTIGRQ